MLVQVSDLLDILSKGGFLRDRALVAALTAWATSIREETDRDCISGELAVRIARQRMLDEAEGLARRINSVHERPQYMRQVAEVELEVGETARGVSLLREVIGAAERMPADWYWERSEVLAHVAKALHHAGERSAASEQWDAAIGVAKAGEQAAPDAIDCSAVLWTISKMLAEVGETTKARQVASGIRDERRRRGALEELSSKGL